MKGNTPSGPPGYTTDDMRRYADALPMLVRTQTFDEQTALSARSVLENSDPTWESRLHIQTDEITKEIEKYLDIDAVSGLYMFNATELRGMVAKVVTRTSSQYAFDFGKALTEAKLLSAQFGGTEIANIEPGSAFEQPKLQQEY